MREGVVALVLLAAACGTNGTAGNPATEPLPPGSPCGTGSAAQDMAMRCATNPQLQDCFLCIYAPVDAGPSDAGTPAVCAIPCRLGTSDCQSGQACTTPNGYSASGCGGLGNLGYCK
jgi:hypothetical protein